MIYLILSEDPAFEEQGLRLAPMNINGKIKSFYIVRYAENKDDAENYCRFGGVIPGTKNPRFSFQPLKKHGEK